MNIARSSTRAVLMLTALALFAVAGNAAAQDESDLSIIKSDGELDAVAGTLLTYTFTVNNAGPDDAVSTFIVDALPAGFTYVSDTIPNGCTPDIPEPGDVSCQVGDVANGEGVSFDMVVAVDPSVPDGTLALNTAVVASTSTDPNPDNNTGQETTLVDSVADLSIIKSDGEVDVVAGTQLTYTFNYENTGPSDAANVTVVDTLPAGFSHAANSLGTCTPDVPAAGQITCLLGPVAANSADSFTVTVDVAADVPDETLAVNVAEIDSPDSFDPDLLNNIDEETTLVEALADVSIVKTANPADLVAQGEQLTYSFQLANTGPSDAQNVQTIDDLPLDFAGQVADMPVACNEALGVVTCDFGTQQANTVRLYDIVIDVPSAGALGGQLNEVQLLSTTTDPDPLNNDSAAAVEVVVAVPAEGTALIAVQKFFRDGNDETSVRLTLECASGSYAPASVVVDPDDFAPGSAFEHTFVVANIPDGTPNPCTVVEESVAGYEATYICGQDGSTSPVDQTLCNEFADFSPGTTACGWTDVVTNDSNLCGIFNIASPVDVEVTKVWEMSGSKQADIDDTVVLTMFCNGTAEVVGDNPIILSGSDYDDEDGDYTGMGTAEFKVRPDWYPTADDPDDQVYTECYVRENAGNNDVVEVDNGCGDNSSNAAIEVAIGMGDECTITNTVFFEGIPTLNQYGLAIMALLMLGMGFVGFRRFV